VLGIARVAEKGLFAAIAITAAIAFLGVMAFNVNMLFGLLVLPVTIMLSAAAVAFVLLRHSEQAAITTGFAACGVVTLVSLAAQQYSIKVLLFMAVCWLGSFSVAAVLRRTVSLRLAVLTMVPVTVLVALIGKSYKDDLIAYWQTSLMRNIEALSAQEKARLGVENIKLMQEDFPVMLADSLGSWVFFIVLCSVFIARHWQASLFNVGGFQKEFHSLKLGREAVLAFFAASVFAWLVGGGIWVTVASALMFVFFIQGLSVVHCLTKQRGLSQSWLTGIYILLWLPPTMLLLSALGLADNFFRLRNI